MIITHISHHDWEKHTTFDIGNLFGTNSEDDDIIDCYTACTIHAPTTISCYAFRTVDDPTTIDKNYCAYVESKNYFMHVAHDKNALCDSYIVDFIHDATESYYERGKHGFMHLNNIKFPLSMFKILKSHLFDLPMLVTLCFIDLFFYKMILHRKWVRLKCVSHFLCDALFYFNSYFL